MANLGEDAASQKFAVRSAATGVGLGVIATTIGLFSPLSANPIGAGLAAGGAITLGAAALKKANDDLLGGATGVVSFGYVLSVEGAPALTRSTIGIGSVPEGVTCG